ncbi:hypothetical protein, conserved [Trypanosoma brucei brucei TREU927]|uniref:AATF leucine zipper-containing domain-containing protein n=1 Tax=Trypanosoma brucei brucei (strain 927/4 GUTat10.1) TaxID=185431 RepID=Q4GZ49_TRYB2|nr:hypothetical protein, conserved [Trypanosoma brucei brucei TREU927]CAJ16179.1 hypothetical protein, conserved [Trypanosoma brucei brucei TREU927]
MSTRSGKQASMCGKKRLKSVSDIINEQFSGNGAERNDMDAWDELGGDKPQIDDYYEGNDSGNEGADDFDGMPPLSTTKRRRTEHKLPQRKEEKRLRRRGPLDPSLSAGDYAATPVDVEAAMDGIFGALEMGEDDEEDISGEGDAKGSKRGGGRKYETEEQYVKWLEAQQAKKLSKRPDSGLTEEDDILQQLESLRSAQVELLHKQESGDTSNPQAREREQVQKAIHHYVMVYSQLLRMRIKLQPVVARAVTFPQYYALKDFLQNGDETIKKETKVVTGSLKELLGTFLSLAAGGKKGEDNGKPTTRGTVPSFKEVNVIHKRFIAGADACIEHWGAKFVQSNSAKLHTVSQPLIQQIRTILSSRAPLRARVQKNRAHVTILGHPEHYRATQSGEHKAARALHIADGDIDGEIYDDGEFLREVVRRGGAVKLQQQLQEIQRELQSSEEPAKRGFHRLTKGKAVNYEPRPKLVGFLLPVPFAVNGQHEVLFKSLFQ